MADHIGNCLGFGFADGLGGLAAAVTLVELFMAQLMNEYRKGLGRREARQQANATTGRDAVRGGDARVVLEGDARCRDMRLEPVGVVFRIALHAGELGQWVSFGLGLIKKERRTEAPNSGLLVLAILGLGAFLTTMGARIMMPFSPLRT